MLKKGTRPAKRFNLLNKGTGIRFNTRPGRLRLPGSGRFAILAAFFVSASIIGAIALWDREALTSWKLFPDEIMELMVEIPERPIPGKRKPARRRVVMDRSGAVVSYIGGKGGPATGMSADEEDGYLVRFAVCLFRENARIIKNELKAKGVESVIWKTIRVMPVYRLKIGPIPDNITRQKAVRALKEMGVTPLPFIKQDYMFTGPVLIKGRALMAKEKVERMSIGVTLVTEKRPATVYKVTSIPFNDASKAKDRLKTWRKMNVEGVVERMGS